jgi:hypothetical protein
LCILSTGLSSCHPSGTHNFEMAPLLLDNLCTSSTKCRSYSPAEYQVLRMALCSKVGLFCFQVLQHKITCLSEYKMRISFTSSSEKWTFALQSHTNFNMYFTGIFPKTEFFLSGGGGSSHIQVNTLW